MEQKATTVDKQKFYNWITDALYPHKVMTAYEVSEVLAAKKYIPLATRQAVQPLYLISHYCYNVSIALQNIH